MTSSGCSCIARMLRVCAELPPRHSFGAASKTNTEAPASLAIRAAQRAALPPPMTSTSSGFCFVLELILVVSNITFILISAI